MKKTKEVDTERKELQLTGGFSLQPKTMQEALDLAKMMSDSDLVPKDFKGKPGNVLIAVQMGAEMGVSPMQAIQNIAVINGRPGVFGDLGKALLLKAGCQVAMLGQEDAKKRQMGWCKITRPDGRTGEASFSVEDAKTAKIWGKEGPWTNYPYRMLNWRAFWFAARDVAADLLKGMSGVEELQDIPKENVVDTTIEQPKRASETKAETAAPVEQQPAPPVEKKTLTPGLISKKLKLLDVVLDNGSIFAVVEDSPRIKLPSATMGEEAKKFIGKSVTFNYMEVDGELMVPR